MSAMKEVAKIGNMDRRIAIQNFTATQDESGGEVLTWRDWKHVSARLTYPSTVGKEGFIGLGEQGFQLTATRNVIFTIRYVSGLNEKMRIIYNGGTYDIISIQELARRRFYLINAQIQD